jgi:phosphoglucosamine mutase
LLQSVELFPQVLLNIPLSNATSSPWSASDELLAKVKHYETELAQEGRILIRKSGTEPLVRVMVEATSLERAQTVAKALAAFI